MVPSLSTNVERNSEQKDSSSGITSLGFSLRRSRQPRTTICPPSVSSAIITRLRPTRETIAFKKSRSTLPSRKAALPMMTFSAPHESIFAARAGGADAAANAYLHLCTAAKQLDPTTVGTLSHGGVEVDYVQDGIIAESFEQA